MTGMHGGTSREEWCRPQRSLENKANAQPRSVRLAFTLRRRKPRLANDQEENTEADDSDSSSSSSVRFGEARGGYELGVDTKLKVKVVKRIAGIMLPCTMEKVNRMASEEVKLGSYDAKPRGLRERESGL
ncbi:hypothetical protein H0H92_007884 [Tricholoma furcatifolium]|nr:hypothetical protein H0H92_007884 [Tricholoma furcatifolium]